MLILNRQPSTVNRQPKIIIITQMITKFIVDWLIQVIARYDRA